MKTLIILYFFFVLSYMNGCSPAPESPPETVAGESAAFDELLQKADEPWSFLFTGNTQVVLTDIHGQTRQIMFDLRDKIHTRASFLTNRNSISPDWRYLLIYCEISSPSGHHKENHLVLIDTQDWLGRLVPIDVPGFELNWSRNTHWFDNETFIVPINRWGEVVNGIQREILKYMVFYARNLTCEEIIEFDVEGMLRSVWCEPTRTILYDTEMKRSDIFIIRGYDIKGNRPATPQETAYFREAYLNWDYDPAAPVSIDVQAVVPGPEGWGDYWEKNKDRDFIKIGGKVIRCSDSYVEYVPKWDGDLQLFIWYEWDMGYHHYFFMDREGHYRKWFDGYYLGKIPKQPSSES